MPGLHNRLTFVIGSMVLFANGASAQTMQPMEHGGAAKVSQPATVIESPTKTALPIAVPLPVCPAGQPFDPSMNMCMADNTKAMSALTFSLNQFAVYSTTSGPRGRSRVTGPGLGMLMYNQALSPRNTLRVNIMGTAEQLTVGDKGTPQLFQTENIDNMHPHDYLMALEFRDVMKLGAGDDQELTFLFAPRGAAATGPVPFMHRASAEGNPDAPLGHNLQDGLHDVSTVLGVAYRNSGTTVEATGFSGHATSWPFPLHKVDSYSVRLTQKINDHVLLGASYADVLSPDEAEGAEHEKFITGWLATTQKLNGATLNSSLIWGQVRAGRNPALNSFLAEAVSQSGMNKLYGRGEFLQITPGQLDLVPTGGSTDAKWVAALTLGYERTLVQKGPFSIFLGGSFTRDFAPVDFRPDYGSAPRGAKLYFRIKIDTSSIMLDGM